MPQPDTTDVHVDSLLGATHMPYNDLTNLPAAVKKLPEKRQRQWMHVWNSAYQRCQEKGGEGCEESAFAQAWGVVKMDEVREQEEAEIDKACGGKKPLDKQECPKCGKVHDGECSPDAMGAADSGEIDTEEKKGAAKDEDIVDKSSAGINDLPDSAFAYIEPGGSKDADGKTTPRSLRHFPISDESHVRNALARLNQSPFGVKAKSKVLAAAHRLGIKLDPERWKTSKEEEKVETVVKFVGKMTQGLVYGVVYEPDVVDTQGDFTSAEEIEKAAHDFLPNAVMNLHHKEDLEDVQVVESYIAPCDFSVGDQVIRKGSWVLVSRILNQTLKKEIEDGEISGYSLEGTASKSDLI